MSLSHAVLPDGSRLGLPAGPVPAAALLPLVGVDFELPCDDPWLREGGTDAHAYLEAAARGWEEHEAWMDFLDEDSPVHALKGAERDLYLHHWSEALSARRVLDVGCGIGRFVLPFLDRGATVIGVDGDLESLRRCAWHAAGRGGRLDLHWSGVHTLPDVTDLDLVIAAEVLCYVPESDRVLAELVTRLRPGGLFVGSWEAPWGWACADDAPALALEHALRGEGILDLEGDRWVRTVSEATLRDELTAAGLEVEAIVPTHYTADGPLEGCLPDSFSLQELLDWEDRCRTHPVWGPLHRIWTVIARRPDAA